MRQATPLRPPPLILGRSRWRGLLRWEVPGHLLTIAPRQTGKGTGAVLPNLLTYRGSVIVLDRGGESYRITARARRMMGQSVFAFDPCGIAAEPLDASTLNPCDPSYIVTPRQARHEDARPHPDEHDPGSARAFERIAQEEAVALAELLVRPMKHREAHWDVEARALLAGLIADVMLSRRRSPGADLGGVRRTLTLPLDRWEDAIRELEYSEWEFVRRTAWRFAQKGSGEQSGVRSTAQAHTHFLDSLALAESLTSSYRDFAWGDGVSIYIILPSDVPDLYARWVRVLLSSILRSAAADRRLAPEILVMLDHPAVVRELDLARRLMPATSEAGIRFWLFVSDLDELQRACGGSWRSVVANASIVQAFGLADHETSRMLSRRAGGALSPSHLLRIGEEHQVLLRRGGEAVIARRCRYYSDREFRGLFS